MAEKEKKATTETVAPDPQAANTGDPQEEAEKILADARAEAEKIIQEAKEKVKSGSEKQLVSSKAGSPPPETTKIRLFKDNDKYKDDVFVAVNGRSYQIRRGESVEVPTFVAEVLERSMKQDAATASLIERESSKYEQESKARNL